MPYVNKILTSDGDVLLDLTGDTVTAADLPQNVRAHDSSGAPIVGEAVLQTYYTGSATPSTSLGVDGDLYFKMG